MNKGMLIVLSGPSGTGKDTIINRLLKNSRNLKLSISATTRAPRGIEKDGKDYHFVSREKFIDMIDNSEFLEYAEYCGNFYGTPKVNVQNMINNGYDVILEIEVEGGSQIKQRFLDATSIFILPPSIGALRDRLNSRGLDEGSIIEKRISQAEREINCYKAYDYVVVNDDLDRCVEKIFKIIQCEHMKSNRSSYIINEVLNNE